jgi:DNA-binding SARP family transcriptional activator/DNA-binding beta-propeller fold protein YncE
VEFRILGPLEARDDDGRAVPLSVGGQRKLLAVLLLHPGEVVSSDRLIDALWEGAPPRTATKALHGYVAQLRRALGRRTDEDREGPLETRPPGYLLRVGPEELDALRFERLASEGRRALGSGAAEASAVALRAALALWRGPALPEFAFDAFAQAETARLESLRLAALEDRIEAELAIGAHAELVGELVGLVQAHPLRERLRSQLMLALYRCGRQADALAEYRSARALLVEELGLEPGDALQRLELAILTHDPALASPRPAADAPAAPAPRAAGAMRGDALLLIDPREDRIVGRVRVGRRPVAVAVGLGSVWVANADDGTVCRVDPRRGEVARTIGVGAPAVDVAVGHDAVWVATGSDGRLLRIDPATETVIDEVNLRGTNDLLWNTTYAVAADAGGAWVAVAPRTLVRVDSWTCEVTARVDVGHVPVAVVIGSEGLWAATLAERAVRVEPRSATPTGEAAVGYPVAAAVGEGLVWIADDRGRVWALDPATAAVVQAMAIGQRPTGIAAGNGAVWVADAAGAVLRLDPARARVAARIGVDGSPTGVAVAADAVWASVQAESPS